MSYPKISVITVVYNNLSGLQRSLQSVLKQTFSDFEYIVIDGASTDGTAEYLSKCIDKRLKFLSEPDRGVFDAMKKAVHMARGEFVAFVDSGNWYIKDNILDEVAKVLTENTQFISMPYIHEKKCGNQIRWKVSYPDANLEHLYTAFDLFLHSAFIRRDVIVKYMEEIEKYSCSGDHALVLKMYTEGVILEIGDIVTVYFEDGGISSDPRKLAYREDRQIAVEYGVPRMKAWIVYIKRMIQFSTLVALRKIRLDGVGRKLLRKSPDLPLEEIKKTYCNPICPWCMEEN